MKNLVNKVISILILPLSLRSLFSLLLPGEWDNASITTQTAFQSLGTSFLIIKASNVIASVAPIRLTDVKISLTDIAPVIETFLPGLVGFEPWALSPFKDLAYNLTIAKLTPDSSMNIKSFKLISLIVLPELTSQDLNSVGAFA